MRDVFCKPYGTRVWFGYLETVGESTVTWYVIRSPIECMVDRGLLVKRSIDFSTKFSIENFRKFNYIIRLAGRIIGFLDSSAALGKLSSPISNKNRKKSALAAVRCFRWCIIKYLNKRDCCLDYWHQCRAWQQAANYWDSAERFLSAARVTE